MARSGLQAALKSQKTATSLLALKYILRKEKIVRGNRDGRWKTSEQHRAGDCLIPMCRRKRKGSAAEREECPPQGIVGGFIRKNLASERKGKPCASSRKKTNDGGGEGREGGAGERARRRKCVWGGQLRVGIGRIFMGGGRGSENMNGDGGRGETGGGGRGEDKVEGDGEGRGRGAWGDRKQEGRGGGEESRGGGM